MRKQNQNAKIVLDTTDGIERLAINNRGFQPVLLLEFIAAIAAENNEVVPVQVITGDEHFLVRFAYAGRSEARNKLALVKLRDYINSNY